MKTASSRRSCSLLALLTLACGCHSAFGQDLSFLTNGLVAYYPLNGDGKDYSGYGNDGTCVNVLSVPDRFALPSGAVSFNGTDSYARIPQSPQLTWSEATNEITISTWVSLPDLNTDVACVYICKYNTADDGGWEVGVNSDGIGFGTDNLPWPSGQGYGGSLGTVQAEQWMHVVVTGSRSRQRVCFYLNGGLLASQYATNFLLGSTVGPLHLGQSPLGPNEFRASQMDDLRIYSRALSAAEVRTLCEFESNANLTNTPPVITAQPKNEDLYVGDTAELQVLTRGNWPLAYQWRQEGTALDGKTNAILTLTNVPLSATGDYTVVVANDFGSVTSDVARVQVTARVEMTAGQTERVKFTLLGGTGLGDGETLRTLRTDGSLLVGIEGSFLTIIDFADPAKPIHRSQYPVEGAKAVEVHNGMAYLATTSQVQVIDIRNASAPTLMGVYTAEDARSEDWSALRLCDNILFWSRSSYAAGATNWIDLIDISNSAHPTRAGTYVSSPPVGTLCNSIDVLEAESGRLYCLGRYADVATGMTPVVIRVLDTNTPERCQELGRLDLYGGLPTSMVLVGNYLYFPTTGDIGWMWSVQIVDVSDPAHPRLARRIGDDESTALGMLCTDIVRKDNYAYLSGINCGPGDGPYRLSVLDLSNPAHLVVAGTLTGGDDLWSGTDGSRVLPFAGNRVLWCFANRIEAYEVTELPAITRQSVENGRLNLQWNDAAKGMKLQRATSLTHADWQDLLGSENTNAVSLSMWGGLEFFRLAKP